MEENEENGSGRIPDRWKWQGISPVVTIFKDDADKDIFLGRLKNILTDSAALCFAWALIPNHFHLLLRTGNAPISIVMKRLLTGHAIYFNRKYRRVGHLFQNRYKSILCQEDAYMLELVRYIHLNPLLAKIIPDLKFLDKYSYSVKINLLQYIVLHIYLDHIIW